jgi:nicotinamide riboside transporter PnuC
MDHVKIIEILATVFTLIGVIFVCIPKKIGIYFIILGSIIWIIFSIIYNYQFLFLQNFFVLILNIYALYSWKKRGIK